MNTVAAGRIAIDTHAHIVDPARFPYYLRTDGRMDYGPELRLVASWIPDIADLAQILGATPQRVFGFARD